MPSLGEGGGRWVRNPGGYSDWKRLTEERAQAARQPEAGAKLTPSRERGSPQRSRKLGFNQARELETMPARIKALEAEQVQIGARLADPALYGKPAAEITQLQKRFAAIDEELTACPTWVSTCTTTVTPRLWANTNLQPAKARIR